MYQGEKKPISCLIDDAISLALKAHAGRSFWGTPYILHPLRVACRLEEEEEIITAILHDAVEDSDLTLDDLRERGYPASVVAALDCLTQRSGESLEDKLSRTLRSDLAVRVRLADLGENISRAADPERRERYVKAKDYLLRPTD